MIPSFTPWSALVGGVLIGLSASLLLWSSGKIAGISGIARRLIWGPWLGASWRAAFVLGLVAGAAAWYAIARATGHIEWLPHARSGFPPLLLVAAGLLTGFGTALANGCTSGHGVCGLGRLSSRSAVATLTFLVTAIVSTYVVRHVMGIQ
ncbi:YeeE/YedE family protein [Pararobbsia silviterrae]|uniref:YeeE/YedE family protein n=1 Tax=Pararobbsia silviterrae TaxID=1792498 RepID=A0A494XZN6_9BURK|nr:YeeE/YedE thiosulfate transporter family protein [Pararobbsia silviterrae]RKP53656.1 YeeE/YedE family protein [Pararobbsia silviterrae]